MSATLTTALLSFVLLSLVFGPLERVFPARPRQKRWRDEAWTDLAFYLGQYLIFAGVTLSVLMAVHALVDDVGCVYVVDDLPLWSRALLAVFLGDLVTYWFHRACHRFDLLWRFHAVHHSARQLDWLAAHREHPLDGIVTQICVNLPGMLLGLPFAAIGGLVAFRGLWAIFIHSNVRLPLGPLRVIFGAPELHHWHHARVAPTRHNFANLAPYLDLVFGTYHRPKDPETYPLGLVEPWPRRYLAQLLRPFRRGGWP